MLIIRSLCNLAATAHAVLSGRMQKLHPTVQCNMFLQYRLVARGSIAVAPSD